MTKLEKLIGYTISILVCLIVVGLITSMVHKMNIKAIYYNVQSGIDTDDDNTDTMVC